MAVFENYEGGDYCSGLIFGKNGAQLLTEVAQIGFEWFLNKSKSGKSKISEEDIDNVTYGTFEDDDKLAEEQGEEYESFKMSGKNQGKKNKGFKRFG